MLVAGAWAGGCEDGDGEGVEAGTAVAVADVDVDVEAEAGAHDEGGGLEHLGHAGAALGAEVAEDDDRLLALLDRAGLDGVHEVLFAVEGAGLAGEAEALLAGDLGDSAAGGEVAAEYSADVVRRQSAALLDFD